MKILFFVSFLITALHLSSCSDNHNQIVKLPEIDSLCSVKNGKRSCNTLELGFRSVFFNKDITFFYVCTYQKKEAGIKVRINEEKKEVYFMPNGHETDLLIDGLCAQYGLTYTKGVLKEKLLVNSLEWENYHTMFDPDYDGERILVLEIPSLDENNAVKATYYLKMHVDLNGLILIESDQGKSIPALLRLLYENDSISDGI